MVTGSALPAWAQRALVVSRLAKASTPQTRLPAPRQMQSATTPRPLRGGTLRYRIWITQGSALPQWRSGPAAYPQPPRPPPEAPQPGPAHRPCRRCGHGRCRCEAARSCSDSRWSIRVMSYLIETRSLAIGFPGDQNGEEPATSRPSPVIRVSATVERVAARPRGNQLSADRRPPWGRRFLTHNWERSPFLPPRRRAPAARRASSAPPRQRA
jgi:hypothetical protein